MQYISQMQTWDLARKITKKSNLPVIDGPTILMKRRRREELWWVEASEMCVWYCFPFWFFTICVRSWKFLFSFSCHFSSHFAKNRDELHKEALAYKLLTMISIITLIIIIIVIIIIIIIVSVIIIIVVIIFIFVFVIVIVIVLVIVIVHHHHHHHHYSHHVCCFPVLFKRKKNFPETPPEISVL